MARAALGASNIKLTLPTLVEGLITQGANPPPSYWKKKTKVLDRTKALYGPRTQAYGETNYYEEKLQVLDRTKTLYGPRTQAYGETYYSKEKLQVLDTTQYNHTSVLGSEARCYWKHGQSSTLLGNPLGWFILGFSFLGNYFTRVMVHSTVISVSLISLIYCGLVLLYLIVSIGSN